MALDIEAIGNLVGMAFILTVGYLVWKRMKHKHETEKKDKND